MKPSEIVAKLKEVLLSASNEVEMQEPKEEVNTEKEQMMDFVPMDDFNKLKAEVAQMKGMMEKMSSSDYMEKEEEVPSELKEEVKEEVKAELKEEVKEELKEELKEEVPTEPIIHTPEEKVEEKVEVFFSQNRKETLQDRIFNRINN